MIVLKLDGVLKQKRHRGKSLLKLSEYWPDSCSTFAEHGPFRSADTYRQTAHLYIAVLLFCLHRHSAVKLCS